MTAPATIADALVRATRTLAAAGIEAPGRESRLLLEHVLGEGPILGRDERPLAAAAARRFHALIGRRAGREPFAHLVGEREFWSLSFHVSGATLVPRPDSETVIEAALAWARGRRRLRLLDLGTGSGCLLAALLSELEDATGIGVDVSPAALRIAERNARALGLDGRARFVASDWGRGLEARFDLIVCNPPYVADGDLESLMAEVTAFEPRVALAGGRDGLDAYRRLCPWLVNLMAENGAAFLEVGAGQATAVAAILDESGLAQLGRHRDLGGIVRCLAVGGPRPQIRESEKKIGQNRFPD